MERADVGLIGLAVMGRNLALNLSDHGYRVAAYNRTRSVTDAFMAEEGADAGVLACGDLPALVAALDRPRAVLLMVKAGPAVDKVLEALVPHLDDGDVVLDGGNSHVGDTRRRAGEMAARGIHFLGLGVSGGEEGARHGPSLMPGGPREGYDVVAPMLRAIAARAPDGEPCVDWLGEDAAGHYVKMVHNGIEYGDMQLIAESYHLLREGLGMAPPDLARTFRDWNEGPLDSYLIEITADVLDTYDAQGQLILDGILDAAGQKGTGRWTAIAALEAGVPLTLIDEAVAARSLSARKAAREAASRTLSGPEPGGLGDVDPEAFVADLQAALYAGKLVSYSQGLALLRDAAREYGWSLNPGRAAALWRAGCIIRSRFLEDITAAYRQEPELDNLLLAPFFTDALHDAQGAWRRTVARAVNLGIPTPALSAGLAYVDGIRRASLPANLIQAQRDYFGAHTFERVDRPRGEAYHVDWVGSGEMVRVEDGGG